jgi:hypothetical protein
MTIGALRDPRIPSGRMPLLRSLIKKKAAAIARGGPFQA